MNDRKFAKDLKVAIFGFGKMSRHHIHAINQLEMAELVAVSDPIMDKSIVDSVVGKKVEFFKDPEELLQKMIPDVVHICTPPETHSELAKLAIRYGAMVTLENHFVPLFL